MTTGIVTDSTCDLPPAIIERFGIAVVPLYINFGRESYLDGVDLSREAFYARLPECDLLHHRRAIIADQIGPPIPTDLYGIVNRRGSELNSQTQNDQRSNHHQCSSAANCQTLGDGHHEQRHDGGKKARPPHQSPVPTRIATIANSKSNKDT